MLAERRGGVEQRGLQGAVGAAGPSVEAVPVRAGQVPGRRRRRRRRAPSPTGSSRAGCGCRRTSFGRAEDAQHHARTGLAWASRTAGRPGLGRPSASPCSPVGAGAVLQAAGRPSRPSTGTARARARRVASSDGLAGVEVAGWRPASAAVVAAIAVPIGEQHDQSDRDQRSHDESGEQPPRPPTPVGRRTGGAVLAGRGQRRGRVRRRPSRRSRARGLVLGVHAEGCTPLGARSNPSATTSSSGRTAASSSSAWSATVATPPTSRMTCSVSTSSRSAPSLAEPVDHPVVAHREAPGTW